MLAELLLPLPWNAQYTYAIPDGYQLQKGQMVLAPLRNRLMPAIVQKLPMDKEKDFGAAGKGLEAKNIRSIAVIPDFAPLEADFLSFLDQMSSYNMVPRGQLVRMVIPVTAAFDPPKQEGFYRRAAGVKLPGKSSTKRQKIWQVLSEKDLWSLQELAQKSDCHPDLVKKMVKAGVIETYHQPVQPPHIDYNFEHISYNASQQKVAGRLRQAVAESEYRAFLLDGVTGSGKTEVYFAAIDAALQKGRNVLVLLPEISLSAQWLERFRARFGAEPVVWHSNLTPAQRRDNWRCIAQGTAKVVVGARSALFLPLANLGVIIIDEEHDHSYKQEEGVLYQARDMSVLRAYHQNIPVILASATPSLESVINCQTGRYEKLSLSERYGGARLPDMEAIDLRVNPPPRNYFLSPILRQSLKENYEKSEQSLLFLNRRGYAPLTLCRSCGHRLECPNCTSWLVSHRHGDRLLCHHCGYQSRTPTNCPSCDAVDSLTVCGPGVERIAEEVQELLPQARLGMMVSDLITEPAALQDMIVKILNGEIDILIGTQMIAKGHHFPDLTLVGVVDGDVGVFGEDMRGIERSFQLLWQVAGRAGRAEKPGRALIQSYDVSHPALSALLSGSREELWQLLQQGREKTGLPPFGKLAAIVMSATNEQLLDDYAQKLLRVAHAPEKLTILGPAIPPLAVLRGRHRRRYLLQSSRRFPLQDYIASWLKRVKKTGDIRVKIDIDPYSFL